MRLRRRARAGVPSKFLCAPEEVGTRSPAAHRGLGRPSDRLRKRATRRGIPPNGRRRTQPGLRPGPPSKTDPARRAWWSALPSASRKSVADVPWPSAETEPGTLGEAAMVIMRPALVMARSVPSSTGRGCAGIRLERDIAARSSSSDHRRVKSAAPPTGRPGLHGRRLRPPERPVQPSASARRAVAPAAIAEEGDGARQQRPASAPRLVALPTPAFSRPWSRRAASWLRPRAGPCRLDVGRPAARSRWSRRAVSLSPRSASTRASRWAVAWWRGTWWRGHAGVRVVADERGLKVSASSPTSGTSAGRRRSRRTSSSEGRAASRPTSWTVAAENGPRTSAPSSASRSSKGRRSSRAARRAWTESGTPSGACRRPRRGSVRGTGDRRRRRRRFALDRQAREGHFDELAEEPGRPVRGQRAEHGRAVADCAAGPAGPVSSTRRARGTDEEGAGPRRRRARRCRAGPRRPRHPP